MIKNGENFENNLYVHRQGYGITRADTSRYGDISSVILDISEYYTNIIDLLIKLLDNKTITL
jgi:hypothetical protein